MRTAEWAIVTFALNAAWQSALAIAIALLAARAGRFAPAAKHRMLVITMIVAVALPLMSLLPQPNATQAPKSLSLRERVAEGGVRGPARPRVLQPTHLTTRAADIIAILWLTSVLIATTRFARALINARTILAQSHAHGDWKLHEEIPSPVTIGRTIVVPRFLLDHPQLLRAALTHERAHIARRDYQWHVITELLAIFIAFHPAVWLLRRRLAEQREIACDELAAGDDRREYARSLVAIAALAINGRAPSAALAMAERHSLETRVASLRGTASGRIRGAAIIPLLVFAAACGFGVKPRVGADLSGTWSLDRAATDFGSVERFDVFTQTIEQRGNRISVRQRRVYRNGVQNAAWTVIADGRHRPVIGVSNAVGTVQWRGDRLEFALTSPGHEEHVAAFVTDNGRTLVCDGNIPAGRRTGRFRFVFRRTT